MNSKILFSDLDETLLNKDKSISQKNRDAIGRLLEQGHYFTVVTGRPVKSGRAVVKELGLTMPGCYMVAFNGAVVYDCSADRVLSEQRLPIHIVKEIFDEAKKAGIHVQTYQQNLILTEKHDRELDFYIKRSRMGYKLVEDVFDHIEKEPNKVLLIDVENQGNLLKFKEEHPELEKRCSCFFSCNEYLEYCPKNTDKGTGTRYVAEFLNVPFENTVAIGDERNDIPMILAAKVGAAVKNAHPQLLDAADYVTLSDNEHSAVAEVIERFILN